MPRDDVHNATDLIRVIRNEVTPRVVVTIPSPNPRERLVDPRATAPLQVANLAIRGQLTPEEKTDRELMSETRHHNRVVLAADRARQRGRFR